MLLCSPLTQSYAGLVTLCFHCFTVYWYKGALLTTVHTEKWCVYLKHDENLVHIYYVHRVSGEQYHEFQCQMCSPLSAGDVRTVVGWGAEYTVYEYSGESSLASF